MASIEDFVFEQFKFASFPPQNLHYSQNSTAANEYEEPYLSQQNLQQQQFYVQQDFVLGQGRSLSQDSLMDIASPLAGYAQQQQHQVLSMSREPEVFSLTEAEGSAAAAASGSSFNFLQGQAFRSEQHLYPQVDTTSVSPQEPNVELLAAVNTHFQPSQLVQFQQQQHQYQHQQPMFMMPSYMQQPTMPQYNFRDRFYSEATIPSRTTSSSFDNFSTISSQSSYSPMAINDCSLRYPKYRVARGISSGGTGTKPPKMQTMPGHHFRQVELKLNNAKVEEICLPEWSSLEKEDKRRIVRLERYQVGNKIVCDFKILGSAQENTHVCEERLPGVDVVEVSCLEAFHKPSDESDDDEEPGVSGRSSKRRDEAAQRSFYITSVEVIRIVELLIGVDSQDLTERRRERGRIRSNLVPFWSKKPISSRMSGGGLNFDTNDFRVELATRIMAYETRKPRGFDKEVRILKWEKLFKALKRALQSYYAEVPESFSPEEDEDENEE